jgi:hypothetical protein
MREQAIQRVMDDLCIREDQARRHVRAREKLRRMSVSELHHRLGRALEDRPGVLLTRDKTFDTNKRCFDGLSLDCRVDTECGDRLQAFAAEAREEMGETRWQQLQAEWEQSDD